MSRKFHMDNASLASKPRRSVRANRENTRRKSRILIVIMLALLGVAIIAVGVLTRQVSTVHKDLTAAMKLVPELRTEISQGNESAAQRSFSALQQNISSARSVTAGPLWKAASFVPILGSNFSAVSEAAVSADDVVARAVGPLMEEYASLDWRALSPVNGQVNTDALASAQPAISAAASAVEVSHERMSGIDTDDLLPSVADPIRLLTKELADAKAPLLAAASAAQLLPSMLGAEEERRYLFLIQNSSESRATGGIPGALAVITVKGGRLELGTQGSAAALGLFNPPIEVDEEQESLFTSRIGNRMQNVNMTPDFPTAAQTAKSMWELRKGEGIDGVLAIDPIVLGHLLKATGPVDLLNANTVELLQQTNLPSTLTAENVSSTLLSDVYQEIEDPQIQDIYFAEVAAAVFESFTLGRTDSLALIDALLASTQEDRLYLWSAHSGEQGLIESTRLAGSVSGLGAAGASFGVFFNDGTGGKMDYYADRKVALRKTCLESGSNRYTVRLNLRNSVPLDAVDSLPDYVTGGGHFGVTPGHIRTNYHVYGPVQSIVETATINGESVAFGSGMHDLRPVGTVTVELQPGESAELELTFSRVVQDSSPIIRVTPTVADPRSVIRPLETIGCG